MEVFSEELSSQADGDLMSGSQNAMMSSSISIKERESSSANDSCSETVESSSTSEPCSWIAWKMGNLRTPVS